MRENRKWLYRLLAIFCVIWALEMVVFNYKTIVGLFSTDTASYRMQNAVSDGLEYTGQGRIYRATKRDPAIAFNDIGREVRVLYLDAESPNPNERLSVTVHYSDGTGSKYTTYDSGLVGLGKEFSIIPGYEPSKYITCSYAGKTRSLQFTLSLEKGDLVELGGMAVNKTPPPEVSLLRMLLLFGAVALVYATVRIPAFQKAYNSGSRWHKAGIVASTALFVVLNLCVFRLYAGEICLEDFKSTSGDQVSQELVDAFEHGQTSLLTQPGEEILQLENPYDYAQRSDVDYPWDHLLYNGKYYSYYGIAPVLLVFLPYHLITGYYFPTAVLCLISACVGSVFISLAYMELIKRRLKHTPYSLVLCGNMTLLFCCGVLFCTLRPSFYENAEAFGFAMFAAALYMTLSSGIMRDGPFRPYKLVIASTTMALAVLSRPTFALYAIAYAVCVIWFLIHRRGTLSTRRNVAQGVAIFLPLVAFGLLQMTYNYLRFGSVTDFGIAYSLTINDFTNTTPRLKLIFLSLWNFLLGIPVVNSVFPYLHGVKETFSLNGCWFADTSNICGILWRVPVLASLFYLPSYVRLKGWKRTECLKKAVIAGFPGIVIPLIIIGATWESGHALRYNVDFAAPLFFVAILVAFTVYNRIQNPRVQKLLRGLMAVATCVTVVVTLLVVLGYVPHVTRAIAHSGPQETMAYYKLQSILSFWE